MKYGLLLAAPWGDISSGAFNKAAENGFKLLREFINNEAMIAAEVIFGMILVFHILMGAAELVSGKQSRFLDIGFWIKIIFVGLITFQFSSIFVPVGETIIGGCIESIIVSYGDMWEGFFIDIWGNLNNIKSMLSTGLKIVVDIATFNPGLIIDIAMFVVITIISFLLMLYMFLQALMALGSSCIVLALGPIALPFGAHEMTKDIAIAYVKAFIVYVILYFPMMVFAFSLAFEIMSGLLVGHSTGWVSSITRVDVTEKLISLVLAPLAGVAIVMAVPNVVRGVMK